MAEDTVTTGVASAPPVIVPPTAPVVKPVVAVQPPVVSQPKPRKKTAKLADLEAALKRK